MNKIQSLKNWNELKVRLKEEIIELEDNDLLFVSGKEDVLIGRLQNKSGKKKEEIIDIINKIQSQKN